jgi:galactitol-specific phosphotransferase system IIB component
MTEEIDRSEGHRSAPVWVTAALAVLGVVALVGLVMAHNASSQGQEIQQALETKVKALQQDMGTQVTQLQQHLTQADAANSGLQSDLGVVTKKLRLTQSDLKKARTEAAEIKTETEQTGQKLAEMDGQVHTELATKASTDQVKTVDGKVDGVRTDLSGTQNDLKMARSELGTLIAKNHEDVEQLRRLGERDYVEFTINAKNKPTKVGTFMVELKGTNTTKKRYNVALIVDDVRIDKKNLPVNEPIFFHQGTDRRPLELVVNTVGKDKVTGYISIPKSGSAQSASN